MFTGTKTTRPRTSATRSRRIRRDLGGRPLLDTTFTYAHFHVLDRALSVPGVEVLDAKLTDEGNFALAAVFGRDPRDPQRLSLCWS